jgi:hypothetical protein
VNPETPFLTDEAIDAIVEGADPGAEFASLAAFAQEVRAVRDLSVAPAPSDALAAALRGEPVPSAGPWTRARHAVGHGRSRAAAAVAGFSVAAKVALAGSVAAAAVAGATAAGVLPDPVDDLVRPVVDVVTPLGVVDKDSGKDGGGHDNDGGNPGHEESPGSTPSPSSGSSGGSSDTPTVPGDRDSDSPGGQVGPNDTTGTSTSTGTGTQPTPPTTTPAEVDPPEPPPAPTPPPPEETPPPRPTPTPTPPAPTHPTPPTHPTHPPRPTQVEEGRGEPGTEAEPDPNGTPPDDPGHGQGERPDRQGSAEDDG